MLKWPIYSPPSPFAHTTTLPPSASRQHSVWHLHYLPHRFLHQSPDATSAAEQDPLLAGLSPVSPATAAGRAGGLRAGGQEGVVAGRRGGVGGDAGMVGDLRLQAGRGDVGGSVGSGDRRGRGGGRGGAEGVAAAAKLSRFAGVGGDVGPGGGRRGRAAGGQAGSARGSMEGQTVGGGAGERGGDGGEAGMGGERWDAEGEGGGWCVRMTCVWTGLTGQDKASNVLLLSHTPLSSSPPGLSSSCPHRTSLPPAVGPLLSPSPPPGSATLAFCLPACQRVWVRHVAYGGAGDGQGEGEAEEEESRADGEGGSGGGGDEGRGRVVHMEGRRCWSVEAAPCTTFLAHHGIHVNQSELATCPLRLCAALGDRVSVVLPNNQVTLPPLPLPLHSQSLAPISLTLLFVASTLFPPHLLTFSSHLTSSPPHPSPHLLACSSPSTLYPLSSSLPPTPPRHQEHRFQVKLALAAHLPARCLAAIRASPFPRRLSHELRCALLAPCLWRLQQWQQQRSEGERGGKRVEGGSGVGGGRRVELVKLCALVGAAGGAADGAEEGEGEEWHTLLGVVEGWIEAALVAGGGGTDTGRPGGEGEGEQGGKAMEVDGEGDRDSAGKGAQGGADEGGRWNETQGEEGREAAASGVGGREAGQSAWEGLLSSQHHRHLLLSGTPSWMPFPLPSPPSTVHASPPRSAAASSAAAPSGRGGERGGHGEGVQVGGEWVQGEEGVGEGDLVEVLRALHGVYEERRLDALCRSSIAGHRTIFSYYSLTPPCPPFPSPVPPSPNTSPHPPSSLPRLAALVWVLAAVLGAHDLCDHYQRHHPSLSLLANSFPPSLSECALPPHPVLPSVVPCVFTWLARTVQYGPKHAAPWLAWMPPSLLSAAALPTLVGGEVGGEGRGREARGGQGAKEGGEWWEEWEGEGEGGPGLLPLVVALFSLLFPRGVWTRPAACPPSKARHKPAVGEEASGGGKAGTDKGGKGRAAEAESGAEGAAAAARGDGVVGVSERCVAAMVAAHMGRSDLQRLPPAVALPLLQALHVCRENPPSGWPAAAYVLVGRDDLAATATTCLRCFSLRHSPLPRCFSPHLHLSSAGGGTTTATAPSRTTAPPHSPHSLSPLSFSFPPTVLVRPLSPFPSSPHSALHASLALPGSHASQGLASASGVGVGGIGVGAGSGVGVGGASDATGVGGGGAGVEGAGGEGMVADGMEHLLLPPARSLLALRFPCDLRLAEVRRLLCSARPVPLPAAAASDSTDPDALAAHQAQLWQVAHRTVALPLGRAAFTFATAPPTLTQALSVPKLVLAGRLTAQNDATVGLDGSLGNLSELATWPEFHNGVAAGLKLARVPPGTVTRAWVVYNRPVEASSAHGGLLMALGLRGHLRVLAPTDFFRDLALEHEATTVGVLLGAAASYRATMDANICKMLYLHIPSRHPPSFPDLELPPSIQTAALVGVGLLHMGSAHRLTTEILLDEIGRKPEGEGSMEREGYSLGAGLALGLVTL
ncbi:unnamed protein product, partial [Closterium sp. NIES-53]